MESLLSIFNLAHFRFHVKHAFHFFGLVPFFRRGSHIRGQPLIEYSVLRKGARPVKEEERRYEEAVRVLPGRLREQADRKSTRLNSSHVVESRMPSSA